MAEEVFADRADLARFGLRAEVLGAIDAGDQDGALAAASSIARDYLSKVKDLPLVAGQWPVSLRIRVCWIAAYLLLVPKGFNPDGPDQLLVKNYDRALAWLEDVAAGRVLLADPVDPPTPVTIAGPAVSAPPAVWNAAAAGLTSTGGGRTGF